MCCCIAKCSTLFQAGGILLAFMHPACIMQMLRLENSPDLMSAPALSLLDAADNQMNSKSAPWNKITLLFLPQTTCQRFFFSSPP